jgi:hypothetical protein
VEELTLVAPATPATPAHELETVSQHGGHKDEDEGGKLGDDNDGHPFVWVAMQMSSTVDYPSSSTDIMRI